MNKDDILQEIKVLEKDAETLDLFIKYKESLYLIEKYKEDNEELTRFCSIYLERAEKAESLLCNGCEKL